MVAELDDETGTLLGVNGLASKPINEVGFVELLADVVVVDALLVVEDTLDDADDDVMADEVAAAAAAAAAAADPCSNCFNKAFYICNKNNK